MLRLAIFLITFFCAVAPATSYAQQTVSLRGGEQDGYSRLVFDWGKNVPYTMTKTPGKLVLKFSQPGSISNLNVKAANVQGVNVISQSPLEVSISVPANSNTRDFQAGSRVIIDVYDAPGQKRTVAPPPKVAEVKAPPAPNPEVKKQEPRVEAKKEEPKKEEVATVEKPKGPPSTPVKNMLKEASPAAKAAVEPVVGADLAPPLAPTAADKLLEVVQAQAGPTVDEPKQDVARPSNLITLSAIEAFGMAVFTREDTIWMVSDDENMMLSPQISGPEAQFFLPVNADTIDSGKIFRVPEMENAAIRGQGGGLLWRIVVPAGPSKTKPTRPVRVDENTNDERGGKIVWPFGDARAIFNIEDPVTGRTLTAVTVGSAKLYAGAPIKFIDFEVLNSPIGIVILPKVDDLQIVISPQGDVEVTRPGGLALTSEDTIAMMEGSVTKTIKPGSQAKAKRVYDLRNWQMGGIESIEGNHSVIMNQIGGLKDAERVEGLLTLGKMYLANGMWVESKGFFDLAAEQMPELNQNAAFIALLGAAEALGLESEDAFKKLSNEELKVYPEIGYWRAFCLADLGDWQQADSVLPDELYIFSGYSPLIKIKLSLVLAEVALRAGDTAKGEQILGFAEEYKDWLKPPQVAALNYLKGEAARQRNLPTETKKFWQPLTVGSDDMYRAKAGLALTRLLVDKKEMDIKKAVDNLERLRYSWRGDEIEAQIAYWLGKTYFEGKEYVKGLIIMREAASFAQDTDVGRKIVTEMTEVFKKLFLSADLDKISALDAATLHDQFQEYMPAGPETDKISERLAERLVKADLLGKASELLQGQVAHLQPAEGFRVITRVAGIYLLDNKPAKALTALDQAVQIYATLPVELKSKQKEQELSLLRARALSEQEKYEQALALLNGLERSPDVNKLRADIAWHAGYWDDAAQALEDVILDRDISLTRPLDESNTALILQRAVALSLAGDRVALSALREQYNTVMSQTDKAKIFEVITRSRQSAALADRTTLQGLVSEVDLFKDFLETYRGSEPAAGTTAAVQTPAATPPATPKE